MFIAEKFFYLQASVICSNKGTGRENCEKPRIQRVETAVNCISKWNRRMAQRKSLERSSSPCSSHLSVPPTGLNWVWVGRSTKLRKGFLLIASVDFVSFSTQNFGKHIKGFLKQGFPDRLAFSKTYIVSQFSRHFQNLVIVCTYLWHTDAVFIQIH